MLSVGRMLPLFKGDYNIETEYVMLDVVLHKGTSWVAKKRVKDIEPSEVNNEYWQILFRISEATLNEIIKAVHEYLADPTHIIPIENGGTGASTMEEARANLGFPHDYITPIANGGTGASTVEKAHANLGLLNKADVQIVSYVGTGTYGEDNPCSLTFNFAPKIIKFMARTEDYYFADNGFSHSQRGFDHATGTSNNPGLLDVIVCDPLPTEFNIQFSTGLSDEGTTHTTGSYGKKSEDGKTISWYNNGGASDQCNELGYTYYFMAIG